MKSIDGFKELNLSFVSDIRNISRLAFREMTDGFFV